MLCYLFWLGFTREDIYNLKNNDFDEKTCTIIYRGKNYVKQRNVTERIDKATSEYIRNYFRSKTYETYTEELGWRDIPYADGDFRRLFLTYLLIYKCVRKNKIVFEFLNLTSRMLPYEDEKLVRQTIISLLPKGMSVKDAEITVNWKNPEILSLLAQKLSITKIRIPSNIGIIETASSHCYELDRDTLDIIEYQ